MNEDSEWGQTTCSDNEFQALTFLHSKELALKSDVLCTECWALSRVDTRKVDALDQWCLRRILDIRWYHRVSNCEVRRLTEQPPLTTIIQKRRLTLFGHLVRMDESADARRILTAVPQSEWRRPVGRPYTSWMATLKNDLGQHNLTLEDAIESNWLWISRCVDYWQQAELQHWWCMPNDDDEVRF